MDTDPVYKHYSDVASKGTKEATALQTALKAGYTKEELASIPKEASLGLGCGNSVAAAELKEGEILLDLGCGAGMDLFLAGTRLGPKGKAIGVDFSEEMIKRGNEIAKKYNRDNVEFVHSSIEKMPFADGTFDVVISNCVLNLVPNKLNAFTEIFRILKPSGRFVVSDIILRKPLPEELEKDVASIVGCVGRAVVEESYKKDLEHAGFTNVGVIDLNKDLNTLYNEAEEDKQPCGVGVSCCAGKDLKQKLPLDALRKYDLNEYAGSFIVKAVKN